MMVYLIVVLLDDGGGDLVTNQQLAGATQPSQLNVSLQAPGISPFSSCTLLAPS